MLQGTSTGFRFSRNELILLAALSGAGQLTGLDDEDGLSRLSGEELAHQWEMARMTLADKGFLGASPAEEGDEREGKIDEVILYLVQIISHPDSVLSINRSEDHASLPARVLYRKNGLCAALQKDGGEEGGYTLFPFRDDAALLAWLGLGEQVKPDLMAEAEIWLDPGLLHPFMSALKKGDMQMPRQMLEKAGLSPADAMDAAAGMLEHKSFHGLTLHDPPRNEISFMMFRSRNALWQILHGVNGTDGTGFHKMTDVTESLGFRKLTGEMADSLQTACIRSWLDGKGGPGT